MRHLVLSEILELHRRLVDFSGGSTEIRDLGGLESAVAQPHATFGDQELYPDVVAKAAALCFSIVMNHPFLDGNKRVGHAAMETLLMLNGFEINADVDEQEGIILDLVAGELTRGDFVCWLKDHSDSY